jgi:transposase
MAEAYPIELRMRVVEAYEAGEGAYPALAARFRLGEAPGKHWVRQLRKEGHLTLQKKGGGSPSTVSLQELESIVERLGDTTAAEITAAYNRRPPRQEAPTPIQHPYVRCTAPGT